MFGSGFGFGFGIAHPHFPENPNNVHRFHVLPSLRAGSSHWYSGYSDTTRPPGQLPALNPYCNNYKETAMFQLDIFWTRKWIGFEFSRPILAIGPFTGNLYRWRLRLGFAQLARRTARYERLVQRERARVADHAKEGT